MVARSVTHTLKNSQGDILALCNPSEPWSPRSSAEVIADIETDTSRYAVLSPEGDTPIHVVDGPYGKYLRTVGDSKRFNNLDELPVDTGDIPAAPWDEVVRFAPILQLHWDEVYYPMDPIDFIRSSRFRHHRGGRTDQGYNKVKRSWETGDRTGAAFYDIPIPFIDSYGLHASGKNRRPRDPNSGSSWNVFLHPRGRPKGVLRPSGRVPVFVHAKRDGCASSKGADHVIQYWWFFGFNPGLGGRTNQMGHQGDWEHATVAVRDGSVIGAYLAQHEGVKFYDRGSLEFRQDRLVVYVAKGSHAAYPTVGSFHTIFGIDRTHSRGSRWHTAEYLLPLRDRPWKSFAGAWGEVGEPNPIAPGMTTGPLGPWHKRHRC